MTASIQPEAKSPSRRALLAGALGGLGTLVASAIGRPAVTVAEGENIQVGGDYLTAQSVTHVQNKTNGAIVLWGGSDGAGTGVFGSSTSGSGVVGSSESGPGVYGESPGGGVTGYSHSGLGVRGVSVKANAIQGETSAANWSGVYGSSDGGGFGVTGISNGGPERAGVNGNNLANGVGVRGTTFTGAGVFGYSSLALGLPPAPAKVGVYGYANQDSSAKGLWGATTSGHGVHGTATTGFAGYFAGKVYVGTFQDMPVNRTTPSAPPINHARLFVRNNGNGKTQLCVRFNTGVVRVIETQP